ncbi:TPA: hypothetical protein DDZ10_01885 [Candidatus Uhrbacteria bacterium]|nr:hypothetical protein [Candidatus Uhrbacteria bacterium]
MHTKSPTGAKPESTKPSVLSHPDAVKVFSRFMERTGGVRLPPMRLRSESPWPTSIEDLDRPRPFNNRYF